AVRPALKPLPLAWAAMKMRQAMCTRSNRRIDAAQSPRLIRCRPTTPALGLTRGKPFAGPKANPAQTPEPGSHANTGRHASSAGQSGPSQSSAPTPGPTLQQPESEEKRDGAKSATGDRPQPFPLHGEPGSSLRALNSDSTESIKPVV